MRYFWTLSRQQKVTRAMKKERKTPKRGTDSEKGSATQAIVRGLVSKMWKNNDLQVTKGEKGRVLFPVRKGI